VRKYKRFLQYSLESQGREFITPTHIVSAEDIIVRKKANIAEAKLGEAERSNGERHGRGKKIGEVRH
jgi:hypothetical protein